MRPDHFHTHTHLSTSIKLIIKNEVEWCSATTPWMWIREKVLLNDGRPTVISAMASALHTYSTFTWRALALEKRPHNIQKLFYSAHFFGITVLDSNRTYENCEECQEIRQILCVTFFSRSSERMEIVNGEGKLELKLLPPKATHKRIFKIWTTVKKK